MAELVNHRTVPLQYRFLVAMQGALGIGNDLNKFSDADMALATKLTALYKTVRTTVQHGNQYRLQSPPFEATQVQYVSRDGAQSVVLAYLHSQQLGLAQPRVQLQGLDPNATYKLQPLDDRKFRGELTTTGTQLMGQGIDLRLTGDFDSTAVVVTRQ
jgi:alpha-galactosidase